MAKICIPLLVASITCSSLAHASGSGSMSWKLEAAQLKAARVCELSDPRSQPNYDSQELAWIPHENYGGRYQAMGRAYFHVKVKDAVELTWALKDGVIKSTSTTPTHQTNEDIPIKISNVWINLWNRVWDSDSYGDGREKVPELNFAAFESDSLNSQRFFALDLQQNHPADFYKEFSADIGFEPRFAPETNYVGHHETTEQTYEATVIVTCTM